MFVGVFVIVLFVFTPDLISAVPKPEELLHNPMKHDALHVPQLAVQNHDQHLDHEAFLGDDEAKQFDELAPEESRRRLGVIVDRIDEDKDGRVTLAELKNWIQYTQRRYVDEDVARIWKTVNEANNASVSWDAYRQKTYGFVDELDKDDYEREENGISYKTMISRDRRRWAHADLDLDDNLNRTEFTAFLHPEDHPSMRDLVVTETIEDIDKNKDGKISVEEYIGDMYQQESGGSAGEPEWVLNERESFAKHRDLNGDGYLDRDETVQWIAPQDFDHAESEAKHLIFEADENDDGELTKDEVLDKYDLFVGSQATSFGEALTRHDEF